MRQRPRCETICSVTRMLRRLNRLQHALPRRSSTYATYSTLCAPTRPHRRSYTPPHTPLRTRTLYSSAAMAHPVASSSHPAQLPALETPHAADAQGGAPKKPKDKKKADAASQHPLEVRFVLHRFSSFCASSRAHGHVRARRSPDATRPRVFRPSHQDIRQAQGGARCLRCR